MAMSEDMKFNQLVNFGSAKFLRGQGPLLLVE